MRDEIGGRIAVTAKLDMDDGVPGSIWVDEALRTAALLDADATLDAIELTQGSSVFKPMFLFRGDVPVKEFARSCRSRCAPASASSVNGQWATTPTTTSTCWTSRQFVPVMRNTKLVLLGGITNRDHVETGMREDFDFVAMGRALLREPIWSTG